MTGIVSILFRDIFLHLAKPLAKDFSLGATSFHPGRFKIELLQVHIVITSLPSGSTPQNMKHIPQQPEVIPNCSVTSKACVQYCSSNFTLVWTPQMGITPTDAMRPPCTYRRFVCTRSFCTPNILGELNYSLSRSCLVVGNTATRISDIFVCGIRGYLLATPLTSDHCSNYC